MADIIFDMPMDEAPGSPVAFDFSPAMNNGKVHGATFVPGYIGYTAHFSGEDYIVAHNPIRDLGQPFTLIFWVRSLAIPGYGITKALLFQFAFSDNSIKEYQTTGVQLDQWQSIALVKGSNTAKVYIDGILKGTINFTAGNPVEWAIKQVLSGSSFPYTIPQTFGGDTSNYALGDLDEVLIFNREMTPAQIVAVLSEEKKVLYKIDEIPFEDYDVYVENSHGVIDALELKEPTSIDWAGEHGQIVDLARPRFKPREIELECWIKAASRLEFASKYAAFYRLFQKPGLHRLRIEINKRKPLLYEVYLPSQTENDKRWRNSDMIGRFRLKLIDPQPVKKVLRFTPTTGNNGLAKIRFTCYDAVNIYWGDGTVSADVVADDDILVSHQFALTKPFYEIIITCEPDNIPYFNSNCIVVWNRL